MKKIFSFRKKKKENPPPPGGAASPCPAGAYELRHKELGKLHRAAATGDLAQVRQRLKKHGIDERDKAQRTPLHLACANGHADVVTFLVENKCKLDLFDSDNRSPLMKAVQCQQEKCAVILLEHGADPNLADASGNTALHLAAVAPNTFLAGMLIEHSARIDAQNKDGCTPLTLAISEHCDGMVELLLKKGADVHARDLCERTPLMTAASGGELKLVKILLHYGADLSHKDTNGWTAEDYAIIHGYASLSKQLAEYADWENTGKACAGASRGTRVPMTPHKAGAAGFTLGAPAVNREGMQQSSKQTPRTGESRKAIDDFSHGDSTSSEKEGSNDTWHTSEEEELDFTPKKPQKPNLTMLLNVSQKFSNVGGGDGSRVKSPKSQKKSLTHKKPTDANLNRGKCGKLLNEDGSDSSSLEEDELEEEEEDENDDGDDDEECEEEEEEDLTQDEKEEGDLEDEETQSNDVTEEEQIGKIEPKEEINQKLGYLSSVKNEGDEQCGAESVSSDYQEICKKINEKMEGSVDSPVSFIDGSHKRLQENITAMSPKQMNNEVSYESAPKQPILQNVNNLQDKQESCKKKSIMQKIFHRNTASSSADSEMTVLKKGMPQPLSKIGGDLQEKFSFSDVLKSISGSSSTRGSIKLENQRRSSVTDDEDTEAEQYKQVDIKLHKAQKQESENLRLGRCKENLRTAFSSSTEEESAKWEQEKEQKKEDAGGKLQTTVCDEVKNSACSNKHQVHNKEDATNKRGALPVAGPEQEEESDSPWDSEEESAKWEQEKEQKKEDAGGKLQTTVCDEVKNSACSNKHQVHNKEDATNKRGALPVAGPEQEEESDSPWDSETYSGTPGNVSPVVVLPPAVERGLCSQSISRKHDNGFSEKSSDLQLKVSAVLERNETPSKKERKKSDLQEELSLEDVDNIEGEGSEHIFHVSSAEKETVKDAIETCGRQVEKKKKKQKHFKMQAVEKEDGLDKLNTPAGSINNQPVKEELALRKNEKKLEDEKKIEEKRTKNFSSEERPKLTRMPTKGKSVMNAKGMKKNENKRQSSKQKANQKIQVTDDSTCSETSQTEERSAAKTGSEKGKVSMQMDVTDDLDLTQSSDTTTEDAELPTSTYKEAMLLLEQLSVDHTGKCGLTVAKGLVSTHLHSHLHASTGEEGDSAILLKIQNILLEYEQRIDREKNRYAALWKEVRKLKSEKEESQLIAEETEDLKSTLAHQEMELKSDIRSLKFSLKQEEQKRLRAEMQYEKIGEQLRKKEDQYCREAEEKQQLELRARNLEMELITLRKLMKQIEEERDETQRQLSQEKSARALQEGILNSHLWRQKELEEETRKTIGKNSEESDTNDREKDLLHKNQLLQEEIAILRLELDQVKLRHQENEGKYLGENESLKEKNDDLQKELKLNEEALTQTVLQYNGQLSLLKTESAMLSSKLEQTRESKDRLETEIESFRSRLNAAVQDLERHQSLKSDAERTFQKERDEWHRLQDKLHHELSQAQETNKSLSQQLSKMERKANCLESELHQLKQTLREKTLLLEMTQKDLNQAQCQAKESDCARQLEKDQVSKFMIKQESMQERLAQLQSENLLLRQQLEDLQNKGIIKEKVVNDVQDRFNDIFNKLRADTEKQVYLMEERNKELNTKCTDLREQVFKYETDKVEREVLVRQLQQELADALKKQSMSEASLEVTTRYRSDLEEDKLRLQKELDRVKTKLQESEEQRVQSELCVHDLKTVLDNKEKEISVSSQKLKDLLLATSGTNAVIKQLEEHVQRLEIENARLEVTTKQQTNSIEALQKDMQASASVHHRLEELCLRTAQTAAEKYQYQQMQKQDMLTMTSKESRSMWEEEVKSRALLENRLAQLEREKAELLEQCEAERKKVKKLVELKRPVEARLDQEMKRNVELQKEHHRCKRLLNRVVKKLRVHESRERESQFNFQGEMKNRYSEMVNEVGNLRTKVTELSQQLELESKKCIQLETQNQDLREELSVLRGNHEKLERSKSQLKEEVASLRHHLEVNMVNHSQIEQYKKEMEERAGQEIRQKLQEVNLFLQAQAASQDRLEQIRDNHHASLRNQLKHRIKDLECELDRIKNTQHDSIFQKESTQAEVEKYKEKYLEEVKIRKSLGNKLERANERLAEANAKLFQERHRNKSLITSSIVAGGLPASPVLYSTELGHLGNNLALNRSLNLGGSFVGTAGNALSSRNNVEAYMDKVRKELDEKITKELEQANAELEIGSARASPMMSTDGSSKNLNIDQDPLSRAIQEYRDVLNKNYLI
ncbi:ankyrin repeat domain-containing protein 26 isoform X23 [Lagopus muta]|uniref:ankyrin repeat domain-containing protein 26 isoform X18 n=1 Tax=Lagopus muta TaxID=64668 RepID=UPI0020A0D203|nr:ankyrin repeat domain-containing protein 26 isoform X18 [Lagopus muta]XP_048812994.1 ankyrin repeat domain-containing protein 26 isoform X19 [Lagopus muta]XP_048812999.1 ankyrin repeat domain-containing protein 26 isoform X20 [Lagopus muta]XP_048813009.1 ankyrin repeat domain-containing protein 26 isoform X21 [Lagopus muta]XP_048813019.1 ankyrin repeat domain-containing protein 26 isoform X22 [Lagopus muta]XP_048813029.1 ankyrin repeat domain-containing protein 26 isoform X23 [Lagopus muta]